MGDDMQTERLRRCDWGIDDNLACALALGRIAIDQLKELKSNGRVTHWWTSAISILFLYIVVKFLGSFGKHSYPDTDLSAKV